MEDDFSPITQGDTASVFNPTFVHADGSAFNLTGATLSTIMREISTEQVIVWTGVWTLDPDPTTGKASYAYSSADVAVPGTWEVSTMITKGGKPVHADRKTLVIEALL